MAKGAPSDLAQAFEQAVGLFRQGRLDDAEKIASRLLKQWPGQFDLLHLLGIIKLQSGKAGAALGLFEAALKANPHSPEAMSNLAMTLATLQRESEAIALFDRAHALSPNDWQVLNSRGSVLIRLGRAADALADFERALAFEPRHPGLHLNRGNALAQLGRFDESIAEFDRLLVAMPDHVEAHFNRGNALAMLGRTDEAVAAYDRALALRPDYAKALVSRGVALEALNRHQEALVSLDRAIALNRNNADAHHNAALALLTLGDYGRGFEEYEWRWRRSGMPAPRNLRKPLWLGEYPPARKTVLLHAEQGLGDTIQFVRYAPLLAKAGAKVVLEVPPELTTLLGRLDGVADVVARGDPLPAFDLHCPLGSLPRALKTELSSIPADVPYLKPNEERIAIWRRRLADIPSPRIAIAWSGSASHVNDRNRSIPLPLLAPIATLESVNLVSIQREPRAGDAEMMARMPRLTHVGDALEDFDDTAAVVSLVDLVISVDTSVVHLAGALGRPTWVLVPFSPDWRWMPDRDSTPWYPTARLFRQHAPGDWAGVVDRVREALTAARSPFPSPRDPSAP
jgi:tetratricopeptide (TPR) repeat protein